jgi:predicted RNA-binding Zn-ribbon protein involved in translation (DUF1610 family)
MTEGIPSDGPGPAQGGVQHQFACTSCGAALEFAPGTSSMVCPYCGALTAIAAPDSQKNDFASYVAVTRTPLAQLPAFTVACEGCGAEQTTTALSGRCPSCKGAVVVTDDLDGQLKSPDGIVPFLVDKERADKEFKVWSGSRWFAPTALKKVVRTDSMVGAYVPHWGYDDKTTTDYTGQRGEHYWDTETYTETGPKGHLVTRTREVQKTRWFPASGQVSRDFVDVLTTAVTSPNVDLLEKLGPWSTSGATGYESRFLAGFETPRYTVTTEDGFTEAQERMAAQIKKDCVDDIGGDEQRLSSVRTRDADVLFRLLLMPLWMATYLFAGRTYHVYVNANTGEVIGERPYSALKIALAVVAVLLAVGAAIAIYKSSSG